MRSDTKPNHRSNNPISLPDISIPVAIEANEISIGELVLDLSASSPPIILKDVTLKAAMSGNHLTIDWLVVNYGKYSAKLTGEINLTDDYPLDVSLEALASSVFAGEDIAANLILSQTLRQLQFDGSSRGALNLQIKGTAEILDSRLPLKMSIHWPSFGWPIYVPTTAESRNGTLSLSGDLDDYAFTLKTTLTGQNIPESALSLEGRINPQRALIPKITVLGLDGFATGSAAADFSDSITWVADMISKDINPSLKWPQMQGKLNSLVQASGTVRDGKWTLNLPRIEVDGLLRCQKWRVTLLPKLR